MDAGFQQGVVMRIDLTQTAASQLANEATSQKVKADRAAATGVDREGDRTTLSSDTASVQSLVSTAMNSPEIRQEKVDSLRTAISSGNYKLDTKQIASSMIDEQA
jgi:negative regulator of flagellin synthesis FlgM